MLFVCTRTKQNKTVSSVLRFVPRVTIVCLCWSMNALRNADDRLLNHITEKNKFVALFEWFKLKENSILFCNMAEISERDQTCLLRELSRHFTACIQTVFSESAKDEWNNMTIKVKQFLEKERYVAKKLTDIDFEMFCPFEIAWMEAADFFQSLLTKNGNVDPRKLKMKEKSEQSKKNDSSAETDFKIALRVQRLTNDLTLAIEKKQPNEWEEIANKYMWANAQLTRLPNILGLDRSLLAFRILTLEASEFASLLHDEWKKRQEQRNEQDDD